MLDEAGRRDCPLAVLAVAAGCLLAVAIALFALPLGTYVAKIPHDVFGYFDAIHRLRAGQQPHADFHTPIGWLAYGLPYLGYSAVGQFGGALEFGSVVLLAMLLPLATVALRGRAPTSAGLALLAALFAVVVVPWPLSESGLVSTQVPHYNRWAWALLTTLLLFGLPAAAGAAEGGARRSLVAAEAAAIAVLLAMLFLLKATYFVVGLVFVLCFGVALARFRRAGALGVGGCSLLILAAHWMGGWVDDYLRDLFRTYLVAAQPGAEARDSTPMLTSVLFHNLSALGLVVMACGVSAMVKRLTLRDLLLVAYVAASCIALATQNSIAPHVLFALPPLFVWMAARCPRRTAQRRLILTGMWIFLLPAFCRQLLATAAFLMAAHGACPGCAPELPRMEGVWFGGLGGPNAFAAGTLHAPAGADVLRWSRRHPLHTHMDLSHAEYLETLRTGLALLDAHAAGRGGVAVATADYVNPFPALLDAPSPKGVMLHLHVGRFISRAFAKNREFVFGDANWLMIPKFPVAIETTTLVLDMHSAYLLDAWQEAAENEHWRLLRRTDAAAGP